MKLCAFPGCTEPIHGLNLCYVHYVQFKRTGTTKEIRRNKKFVKCKIRGCKFRAIDEGLCDRHRGGARQRKRQNIRKNNHLCIDCGKPAHGTNKTCEKCLEIKREATKNRYIKRERLNLCAMCGKPSKIPKETMRNKKRKILLCEACFYRRISQNITKNNHSWKKLKKKLEEQDFLCFYSGERLEIGVNATIDHKKSKANKGSNSLKNLVWASWSINKMKCDLNEKDFINMCLEVCGNYKGGKNE